MNLKINVKNYNYLLIALSLLLLASSCSSSKKLSTEYYYFKDGADTTTILQQDIILHPNDLLSINVFSRTVNQEQATIFNLPATTNPEIQGYRISDSGYIDFPVIGAVMVMGFTKTQLQSNLVERLSNYIKNPAVIIKFLQFNVNVLGEVHKPGLIKFNVDKVTVIDALSAAGDLTDFGKRDNILVVREEGGTKISHPIDLRNKSLFESPYYILHPNDIVYVSPNKYKLKGLGIDPEAQRKTSLLFNVISVIASIASLLIIIIRR